MKVWVPFKDTSHEFKNIKKIEPMTQLLYDKGKMLYNIEKDMHQRRLDCMEEF